MGWLSYAYRMHQSVVVLALFGSSLHSPPPSHDDDPEDIVFNGREVPRSVLVSASSHAVCELLFFRKLLVFVFA